MLALDKLTLDDYILTQEFPTEGFICIDDSFHNAQIVADYIHNEIKKLDFYKHLPEVQQTLGINVIINCDQGDLFLCWYKNAVFQGNKVKSFIRMYTSKSAYSVNADMIKFDDYFTINPNSKHRGAYHSAKSFNL